MIANIFFLIICAFFIATSTIHLIVCAKLNEKLQTITKTMLIPFLLAGAILAFTFRWPDSKNLIIYSSLALTFAYLGNIFFIKQENTKQFALGTSFFILSNLSWLVILFPSIKLFPINIFLKIVLILFYITGTFFAILIGRKLPKSKIIFLVFYSLVLCFLSYATVATFIGTRTLYSILQFCGTSFLIATSFLFLLKHCEKPIKHNQFFTMLLYLVSQLLITSGIELMLY